MLLLTTIIWGSTFIAQKVGAGIGPATFLFLRMIPGTLIILPLALVSERRYQAQLTAGQIEDPIDPARRKKLTWIGGSICGAMLFLGSFLQQWGIGFTTAGKAGFLTAIYSVLVPIFSIFIGKKVPKIIWLCVVMSTAGLYMLCMTAGSFHMQGGDLIVLACSSFFAFQILSIDYFVTKTNPIMLSTMQNFFCGIFSLIAMLVLETPTMGQVIANLPSILYAGILSSGVAYTLQIVGQKGADPTQASLILCLESVFSAVFGALLLHEFMTARQLLGAALIFVAIVLSQVPLPIGKKQTNS